MGLLPNFRHVPRQPDDNCLQTTAASNIIILAKTCKIMCDFAYLVNKKIKIFKLLMSLVNLGNALILTVTKSQCKATKTAVFLRFTCKNECF